MNHQASLEHRHHSIQSAVGFPEEAGLKLRLEGRMGIDYGKSVGQTGKLGLLTEPCMGCVAYSPTQDIYSLSLALPSVAVPSGQSGCLVTRTFWLVQKQRSMGRGSVGLDVPCAQ